MASNGIVFRPGRGPSFILVGLVVIVIILFYSYWGVSSKNNKLLKDVSVLQDRLRVLAARKLTADKKGSALVSQITQMQDENEKVVNSKESKISDISKTLKNREAELTKFRQQEKNYREELETLKKGVNSSSLDLQKLKGRADELLTKYKELKDSHSSLLLKVTNLTSERDVCQKELVKVKMDLDQQKKTQEAKVVPSDMNVLNKRDDEKNVTEEGQSIDEGSDKEIKKSKKEDEDEDTKKPEKDDENKDDENTESPKEEKEKESVEVTKPVPSKASANQNNASVSASVPENIKPDGNKSQNEETDKGNQGNPDNSEEVEKETGKDEESIEQQNEADSPEEKKDSAQNNMENENGDEENEEDDGEEEESDDDLNKGGRLERSTELAADMRRRMRPLPIDNNKKGIGNEQPADNMDEIEKLQRNPRNAQAVVPGRINPLEIPRKVEEMRKRKKAEDQDE